MIIVIFMCVKLVEMSKGFWISIIYGNNKFVAVCESGFGGVYATYSEDGINWETKKMDVFSDWSSITYGNERFVVVSSSKGIVAYSEDGITWSKDYLNYKAVESEIFLSAEGCEDRKLYIENNEIILDSMFVDEETGV